MNTDAARKNHEAILDRFDLAERNFLSDEEGSDYKADQIAARRAILRLVGHKDGGPIKHTDPEKVHESVRVEYDHHGCEVDVPMKDLLVEIWKAGWTTSGSCQERPKSSQGSGIVYGGLAWVGFVVPDEAKRFANVLAASGMRYSIENAGPDGQTYTNPEQALRALISGGFRIAISTGITVIFSRGARVCFAPGSIDKATDAVRRFNAGREESAE